MRESELTQNKHIESRYVFMEYLAHLFVTSKSETMNSPIHEFEVLHKLISQNFVAFLEYMNF